MGCCSSKASFSKQAKALASRTYVKAGNDTQSDVRGEHYAKVVSIYDGDTITVSLYNGIQTSVRLAHINCAELANQHMPKDWTAAQKKEEHEEGLLAKNQLMGLIGEDGIVRVIITKRDKYMRALAEVYTVDKKGRSLINLSERMLADGYALPYEGKGSRDGTGAELRRLRRR